ncbi:MAG: hypothetical protein Q8L60_06815 [Gammaproteobacteria bacterium]|nr:hypothetical protein [Gammaproteobacteria bacterium]MDP2140329.1 hypothetical protein [Gammaproteobacteria bacterium]MDP2346154.1 hypothetical protein [Gammaproteobacteria bacterium]
MSESPESPTPSREGGSAGRDELAAWFNYARQVSQVAVTAVQLLHAEARLAISSARRLFIITAVMLPIVLLAWIGINVLFSWIGYQLTAQYFQQPQLALGVAIVVFLVQQLLAAFVLYRISIQYRHNLSLPVTRRHLQEFTEGLRSGTRSTE